MRTLAMTVLAFLALAAGAAQDPNPVDSFYEAAWKESGKKPRPPADDAVFLRRITLDLAGRLPAADEVRAFLKKNDRAAAIETLLQSQDAAGYYADLWMQWLMDYDFEVRDLYEVDFAALHAWLRKHFLNDLPYDEFVRSLLADRGSRVDHPAVNFAIRHIRGNEPPVKLAVMSARLFLARDIRCAQCHDHPFGKMTQEDFWGYVAFFRPLSNSSYGLREEKPREYTGTIADHLGEVRAAAKFLDGRAPAGGKGLGEELARLTLSADGTPYARAFVERFWRILMGRPAPAALLEKLVADFEANGRRPRHLLRRIVDSRAYQRSSAGAEEERDAGLAGPLKAMNLVQFMTSFTDAFDLHGAYEEMFQKGFKDPKTLEIFKDRQVMRLFFHRWAKEMVLPKGADPEATQASGTVRLALKMMNNTKIQSLISPAWGVLKKAMRSKSRPGDRVELLFLSLLGRLPDDREKKKLVEYVEERNGLDKAYEDVFWVLVNSGEFLFVH